MDKDSDVASVVTQYIICECGDNFPNETLLNTHLANGHGSVEVFLCDVCSSCFPTESELQHHTCSHGKTKEKSPPETLVIKSKSEKKKPPVIKLRNLKRLDSISLIQSLKSYSGLVKLEPAPVVQEPELLQMEEQPSQVLVKSEVQEPQVVNEEIYYQCDVCNTIFYTESDFNMHYQSTHAIKVEPTPEEILGDHLIRDHIDDVNVKAEVESEETAYYYECEIVQRQPGDSVKAGSSEGDPVGTELRKDDVIIQNNKWKVEVETNKNESDVMPGASTAKADASTEESVLKKKGAKKKESKPRKNNDPKPKKPQIDVYQDMPEGVSEEEAKKIAEERLKEIKREKWRQYAKSYRERHPEKSRQSAAKYAHSHPEVKRKASAKYAKKNPEVNRRSSAKYSKSHPEVGRNSSAKYAEKKKKEKLLGNVGADEIYNDDGSSEIYQDCLVNEFLCIEGDQKNIDGGKT